MTYSSAELGSIAEFINGAAFSPADWGDEGRPIIRIQNLTDPQKPFNRTHREVSPRLVVQPGDLLVSWSATLGVFTWGGSEEAVLNQHIFRVLPRADLVDKSYLRHMLSRALDSMASHLHGATMQHVNRAAFLGTDIPLPPLPEQRRIASILDEASELATRRRHQLDRTKSLLGSTYVAMFGDLDANHRNWPTGVVNDLVSGFSSGKSIVGDGESESAPYRVLKVSAVTTGRFNASESKPLPLNYMPPVRHLVRRGDLLISRANTAELVGATALVEEDTQGLALPDKLWRFEWAAAVGDPSIFVWQTFSRPEFRRRISEIASGTGGSMKNISQGAVLSLPMPIPPIEMREAFAHEFSKVERLRKLHLRDLTKLDELFASLQYRAFRGEL